MNQDKKISISKATFDEIKSILLIQENSLLKNKKISNERNNGFLRTQMSIDDMKFFIENGWMLTAKNHDRVIGYAIAGEWTYFSKWDIFNIIFGKLKGIEYQGIKITKDNTYQYGPICIEPCSQGSTIFPTLFSSINSLFLKKFELGLTFIDKRNNRSFHAHTKNFNMEIIDSFTYDNQEYYILPISDKNITSTCN